MVQPAPDHLTGRSTGPVTAVRVTAGDVVREGQVRSDQKDMNEGMHQAEGGRPRPMLP